MQQLGVLHARAKVVKSYQGGPDGVPSRQKLLERVTVHQQTTVNFSRPMHRENRGRGQTGPGSRFSVPVSERAGAAERSGFQLRGVVNHETLGYYRQKRASPVGGT